MDAAAALEQGRQREEHLRQQIDGLTRTVQELQKATSSSATPSTVTVTRPRYPDVPPYTGEDKSLYPMFLTNLRTKFAMEPHGFRTEEEQVLYAFGRLQGKASRRMHPWINVRQEKRIPITTLDFIAAMDRAFKDQDVQRRALERLNHMKQGGKSLQDFLSEFEQALADAGALELSDAVRLSYLEAALNKQLLSGLVGAPTEETYDGFVALICRINDQQKRLQRMEASSYRAAKNHAAAAAHGPDKMDWEPSRQIAALKAEIAAISKQHPGSDGSYKARAKWVSQSERNKRKENKECLRCGKAGHFIRECHLGPPEKPASVAAISHPDPAVEYDTETASDQEN